MAFFSSNGSAHEKRATLIGDRRRCKVRHYTGVRAGKPTTSALPDGSRRGEQTEEIAGRSRTGQSG
jgi:hypothetical protein